ncbi:MAG: hypothetical protein HWE13_10175 [Gammaproteobacteria bacterium]|nr:hypothetical protein [Gammaproteobacteria bacterium]
MTRTLEELYGHDTAGLSAVSKAINEELKKIHKNYGEVQVPSPLIAQEKAQQWFDIALTLKNALFRCVLNTRNLSELLDQQGITGNFRQWILDNQHAFKFKNSHNSLRPDFIFDGQDLKLLEFNVSSALGGLGVLNRYISLQQAHELDAIPDNINLRYIDVDDVWYPIVKPNRSDSHQLTIDLVIDPDDDIEAGFYRPDFHKRMRDHGFDVVAAKIAELTITESGLMYNNRRVDYLYSNFPYDIFYENQIALDFYSQLSPLIDQSLLKLIGHPIASVLETKSNIALLSNGFFDAMLTSDEIDLIQKHIPNTDFLRNFNNCHLIEFKDEYILKPVVGSCGGEVVIGKTCTDEVWVNKIKSARQQSVPYIVQRYVEQAKCNDPQLILPDHDFCCFGIYIFDDQFGGLLYRGTPSSDTGVVNATSGALFSPIALFE